MVKSGKEMSDISPEVSYWCQKFVYCAIKALESNSLYSVTYVCIPYFLSALPHVVDETWRKRTKFPRLFELLEEPSLTGPALEFAQTLQSHRQEIEDKWAEGERKMLAGEC